MMKKLKRNNISYSNHGNDFIFIFNDFRKQQENI